MRILLMHLAVGSLALCLSSGSLFGQQNPPAEQSQSAKSSDTTAAGAQASADAQAQAAATSAPSAAAAAPVVTFEKGQLTIVGNNATLSDVLAAVQQKTGAVMESAAGMSTEKVIGQFGPADPGTVIAALLNGTSLNYVLVGAPDGHLAKVLLTLRPAHVGVQNAEEGGPRRRHRGIAEAAAFEAQEPSADTAQLDPATLPDTPAPRKHRRGAKDAKDTKDAQGDATDQTASTDANGTASPDANGTTSPDGKAKDATASNNANPDGTNPTDPNTQSAADPSAAIGAAIAASILPSDTSADIMKAVQHQNNTGDGSSPTPSPRSRGFGPNATGLGGGTSAPPVTSGAAVTPLGNGMSILGPAVTLPNGAIFFPGGSSMPVRR